MDRITITKNGVSRKATNREYTNRLKERGYTSADDSLRESTSSIKSFSLKELKAELGKRLAELEKPLDEELKTLESYKSGGGWYTFPGGVKFQGDEAKTYYEENLA